MIIIVRRSLKPLFLLFLMASMVCVCWAHAILMDSTPKPNAVVKGPNLDIHLRYNVRVDGSRSRVYLVMADGTKTKLVLAAQSAPEILQSRATGLKPGRYKLEWDALASDGHMSRGEIPFTVD
jgi:copper resistance protein C